MKYKDLPINIRSRIKEYFIFKYQKNYFKEREIMANISEQLRQSVYLHTCKNLLESVVIFKGLPMSLLIRIVTCMKSEVYLPNDIIVSAATVGESMFFIASGTVAVYTSEGKEVAHLVDGAHFGEIALVMDNEKRVANVVAVEPCEIYSLKRNDFLKAIDPYPELFNRIKRMALYRLQQTMAQVLRKSLVNTEFNIHSSQLNFIDKLNTKSLAALSINNIKRDSSSNEGSKEFEEGKDEDED